MSESEIEYDGRNAKTIVEAMNLNMMSGRTGTHVEAGADSRYGKALVIDQVWDDGQRVPARWVIQPSHRIDTMTGAVFHSSGLPVDYADLHSDKQE